MDLRICENNRLLCDTKYPDVRNKYFLMHLTNTDLTIINFFNANRCRVFVYSLEFTNYQSYCKL